MNKKPEIIFLGHDSSLTGAPILLLNLIELICKTEKYEVKIILKRGGVLEKKYQQTAPVRILKPADYSQKKNFLRKLISFLRYRKHLADCLSEIKKADYVFNNTVANGELVKRIRKMKKPVTSYIHELESTIDYFNSKGEADKTFNYSNHLVYPSKAVAENLIHNHQVMPDRLSYLPYFIKDYEVSQQEVLHYKERIFAGNKIPSGKFYVAGMGTATHRKGIDLFLEVCKQIVKRDEDFCFVWVGEFEDEQMRSSILEKVKQDNLGDFFFVTGRVPHASYNLSPFDLFFLSSREDPYPLVVLEAALLKIPSLYFTKTGGIDEFIGSDAGWGIDNLDTVSAASKIIEIKKKPECLKEKGMNAFKKVKQLHTNETAIIAQFEQIINR